MTRTVLALNAGSSTLKYALYRCDERGESELFGATLPTTGDAQAAALESVLQHCRAAGDAEPTLVGHRLVHGGPSFTAPVKVDVGVLGQLRQLTPLAPLHLPPALRLLELALKRCPDALHVACFDTAFHATLPEVARRFALTEALYARGVRRYGFHGLSYEYVLSALGSPAPERLIIAHLGSGASLAAILHGRCIDTSMGLTPTGGIPMGTRSGDLDPGVLLHLMREFGYDADRLEQLLNHESGLQGLAGSSDMTELLSRSGQLDARALSAIEQFAYAIKKQIGAYVAALGGLDCLVFTGGIGEHAPFVRELVCAGLEALGIELNAAHNAENAPNIAGHRSRCQVRVIATNEDAVIARATHALADRLRA